MSSQDSFELDPDDPYYKKIKKLIMFKETYKNLENQLLDTQRELFHLQNQNNEKENVLDKDYNYLMIENEQLRKKIQELESQPEESPDQKIVEKAIKWKT